MEDQSVCPANGTHTGGGECRRRGTINGGQKPKEKCAPKAAEWLSLPFS